MQRGEKGAPKKGMGGGIGTLGWVFSLHQGAVLKGKGFISYC